MDVPMLAPCLLAVSSMLGCCHSAKHQQCTIATISDLLSKKTFIVAQSPRHPWSWELRCAQSVAVHQLSPPQIQRHQAFHRNLLCIKVDPLQAPIRSWKWREWPLLVQEFKFWTHSGKTSRHCMVWDVTWLSATKMKKYTSLMSCDNGCAGGRWLYEHSGKNSGHQTWLQKWLAVAWTPPIIQLRPTPCLQLDLQ